MPYDQTKDRYQTPGDNGGCASRADLITPADSDLAVYYTSLYVGVSGDLAVTPLRNAADTAIIYRNVPVGFFPVAVRRVWNTGTAAGQIIGNRD